MLGGLVFVLKEIKRVIEKYGLVDLYTNYANTLEAISKESTPELQAALKDYRTRINEAHAQINPGEWSYSQAQIFDKFGGRGVVGEQGLQYFKDALSSNQANVPGAVTDIRAEGKAIADLMTKTDNVLSSLGKFATDAESVGDDEVVVQIVFDNQMSVDNLVQLSKQASSWQGIIRAYSMLAKKAPENTRIISISKSSPMQLLLAASPLVAKAIKATVTAFLEIWTDILDMKVHALALEDKKLSIAGKRLELMAEIERIEQERIVETVKSIAEVNQVKGLDDGIKHEAINALLKSGPELYAFITSGGKVDTSVKDKETHELAKFKLEPKYRTTALLQDKVQKLLEAGEAKIVKKPKVTKKRKSRKTKSSTTAKKLLKQLKETKKSAETKPQAETPKPPEKPEAPKSPEE